jgi:CheY-like chemotaxis protein/HPt (histidine-containing phosphotransfer) domain-containing protein
LRFEVEDTGIGIPPAAIPHLFEAFSQVDGSLTRKHGGTGLGLAICQRLTQLLGGEIGVSSELGRGSCFWLQIPLEVGGFSERSRASVVIQPGGVMLDGSLRGVRVLVADDSPVNCGIISEQLVILGCEVDCVEDGYGAVRAVDENEYSIILMDCQMPRLDGYEATLRIRAKESGQRHTPIVATTAHAFESERQRALAAGMDDHLPKPITIPNLAAMLQRWVPCVEHWSGSLPVALALVPNQPVSPLVGLDRDASDPAASCLDPNVHRSANVVRVFRTHVPQQLRHLEQAVQCAASAEIAEAAHRLKGTCLMFGAPLMAELCLSLERGRGDLKVLCAMLLDEHARVVAELDRT